MVDLAVRLREAGILDADGGSWRPPGCGRTPERHRRLLELGRLDLSLARLAEAHADALAILCEAGKSARPGTLYGVWASDGPRSRLEASPGDDGAWRLQGEKRYCSGAPFVSRALVSAHASDAVLLFEIDMNWRGVRIGPPTWASSAMADTETGPVEFDDVVVPQDGLVGGPDWYLRRPGFWHGALGPAACWAGGASFLVDAATRLDRRDPHSQAQIGALRAAAWGLGALLDQAGLEIDADPDDRHGTARTRALMVRHLIERQCTDVLDRFGRCTGPELLAFDPQVARQHTALALYIRQCHAERDLEQIGAGAQV